MNYAEIKNYDIANGPGVRVSLFVSGCTHRCKGCFNEIAWDFGYGKAFNDVVRGRIIAACEPYYISGLSILGGEPMEARNQEAVLLLLREFRNKLKGKTVWCYSGYTYEELTDKSCWPYPTYSDLLFYGTRRRFRCEWGTGAPFTQPEK